MARPLVSVVIPSYNGDKVVARAIRSVQEQEGDFDIEILVIDDCSTDRTRTIAEEMGAKVFVTGPTNSGGPNKGRNIGLRQARGDYVCLLDQDDEWLPGKLAMQLKIMREAEADICYSSYCEAANENRISSRYC